MASTAAAAGGRQGNPLLSRRVLKDSLVRLSPLSLLSNPVMLIVELTFFIVATQVSTTT